MLETSTDLRAVPMTDVGGRPTGPRRGRRPVNEVLGARERQREILAVARENGRVDVTSAAGRFGVAAETIRRDMKALERNGLIRRSYGSAYPVVRSVFETDLASRETNHPIEKQRIAEEAVRHLDEAETVFVDEGYLPQLLAQSLPLDRNLTVVTASLSAAAVLAPRPNYTVLLLGGLVRGRTLATVEQWAIRMLAEFVIDLAYVGANGISLADGLTTPDPRVAEVKAAAVRSARRRIFIGTCEKFGTTSFCRFAHVKDLELIITDGRFPSAMARQYSAAGPDVIRC
ncbi:MAG TPA: DeoR/GlpR family DNA-binding transcription regulator [Acidimicrobiales bacterium]|nr:DeoR/GlpR family DNA-binding transcription regulator [Acidimicrobiales bacterium]